MMTAMSIWPSAYAKAASGKCHRLGLIGPAKPAGQLWLPFVLACGGRFGVIHATMAVLLMQRNMNTRAERLLARAAAGANYKTHSSYSRKKAHCGRFS